MTAIGAANLEKTPVDEFDRVEERPRSAGSAGYEM